MKPLKQNILIELVEPKKETASGIILKSSDEVNRGKVLAIGSEITDIEVGDELILDWSKVKLVENDTYIVSYQHVVAVIS